MKISVFLVTLMAASSMALPMIISPLPLAARDAAVDTLIQREPLKREAEASGGTQPSRGNFKREAAGIGSSSRVGPFKREAAGNGSSGRGGGFKREAAGNGSTGRGGGFKREAGGNGSGGRGVGF